MELVLIWIFLAVIAGVIGSNKGRGGGGWFLFGLIFGVFAVILVAVLPSRKVTAEAR